MAKPLDDDLRKRIVESMQEVKCCRAVGRQFRVAASTVSRLMQRRGRRVPSRRRPNQRQVIPGLYRGGSGSRAQARRHRRHGQPGLPQRRRRARSDRRRRRRTAVPPALQPGPRPDRAGVRQAQALAAESQGAGSGKALAEGLRHPPKNPARRMRQLSQACRLCCCLKEFRSSLSSAT